MRGYSFGSKIMVPVNGQSVLKISSEDQESNVGRGGLTT